MDMETETQQAAEKRRRVYDVLQETFADEGEALTGWVVMTEWDTGQRQYLSRMSGDSLGRPLALHRIDGLVANVDDHDLWTVCMCPSCVAAREEEPDEPQ